MKNSQKIAVGIASFVAIVTALTTSVQATTRQAPKASIDAEHISSYSVKKGEVVSIAADITSGAPVQANKVKFYFSPAVYYNGSTSKISAACEDAWQIGTLTFPGVKGKWYPINGQVTQSGNTYSVTWNTGTITDTQKSLGYGTASNYYVISVNVTDNGTSGYYSSSTNQYVPATPPMTCTGNPAWGQGSCTGVDIYNKPITSCAVPGRQAHAFIKVTPQ